MELIILGSGTSVPHPKRAAAANWLETSGGSLLLDIGPDTSHRMAQEGLEWPALDAVWISHFHLDHLGGLTPLLFGLRWAPQVRERKKPLRIFGPRGTRQLLDAFDQANNYRLRQQCFPIEIIEVDPGDRFEVLPGVHAQTLSTPHTQESLSLRVTDRSGASLVYTSDTGYTAELAPFALRVDLLLIECSYYRAKAISKHLELKEAMQIASLAKPKKVVLTHLYSDWDGLDVAAEASKFWTGTIIEARDGLRLQIH